jgi:hypothetical protein
VETNETISALCVLTLFACLYIYSAVTRLSKQMEELAAALGVETRLARASGVAPDIEEKIKAGKINQAIQMHRLRHEISLGQAEKIIRQHAAAMAAAS